ncbi:MAG: TetR/AcrR family transcriptional regulator [bacterium]|nr:TetR/AcrR family transcriptional regulator [bacterium]
MTPRIVDKEKKKQEILRGALKVFARRGVHDFKMIQVAQAAGVGKGTLYEYFSSKEEIVVGSMTLLLEDLEAHLKPRLANVVKPVDQVREYFFASFEFFVLQKRRLDVLFDFYAAGLPRKDGVPLLQNMAGGYQQAVDFLAEVIQKGIDSGDFRPIDARIAALSLLAMLDGLLFQSALGMTAIADRKLPEKICDVYLGGLLK